MHFYVDETGHTGPNLFDRTQPVLSYGVLSSPDDLDKVQKLNWPVCEKNWVYNVFMPLNWACTALMMWSIPCLFCRRNTGYGLISGRWLNGITPLFHSSIRYLTRD